MGDHDGKKVRSALDALVSAERAARDANYELNQLYAIREWAISRLHIAVGDTVWITEEGLGTRDLDSGWYPYRLCLARGATAIVTEIGFGTLRKRWWATIELEQEWVADSDGIRVASSDGQKKHAFTMNVEYLARVGAQPFVDVGNYSELVRKLDAEEQKSRRQNKEITTRIGQAASAKRALNEAEAKNADLTARVNELLEQIERLSAERDKHAAIVRVRDREILKLVEARRSDEGVIIDLKNKNDAYRSRLDEAFKKANDDFKDSLETVKADRDKWFRVANGGQAVMERDRFAEGQAVDYYLGGKWAGGVVCRDYGDDRIDVRKDHGRYVQQFKREDVRNATGA